MSYDSVRAHLDRCRQNQENESEEFSNLVDALEHLTEAVEYDMAQIKGALGHIAGLIEDDS